MGYERELLFQNDGYFVSDVSLDGRWVALDRSTNCGATPAAPSSCTTCRAARTTHVTPHEGDVQFGTVGFTPNSSQLYYSTNGEGEFAQVWSYGLTSAERAAVLQADWDVMYVVFSRRGRYRVSAVNADAQTEITSSTRAPARRCLKKRGARHIVQAGT
ncbi:MAG TPA: hypothetical protein VMT85_10300 [Thermoanaerobaculia bacterium]|nr:hypothetical protein [Thermoanaerobaculia bacterium]